MATQYTKTEADGKVQYQLNGANVEGTEVPVPVRNALNNVAPGTAVDELGDAIDNSTDLDESADEDTPTDEDNADDQSDDEEEAAPARRRRATTVEPDLDVETPQSDPGMGFKRAKGKTLSIFSNQPHEVVRNVAGVMVPMTKLEALGDESKDVAAKTDAEIIDKLKSLKKL